MSTNVSAFPLMPSIHKAFAKAYVEKQKRKTKITVLKISYCTSKRISFVKESKKNG